MNSFFVLTIIIWSPGFNPSRAAALSSLTAATKIPTEFPPATWIPTLPVLWNEMTRASGLKTKMRLVFTYKFTLWLCYVITLSTQLTLKSRWPKTRMFLGATQAFWQPTVVKFKEKLPGKLVLEFLSGWVVQNPKKLFTSSSKRV